MTHQTIRAVFPRDTFIGKRNPQGNEVIASQLIFNALRKKGVPLIGILGVIAVEHGTLKVTKEDGLDGDEFVFEWTGVPMPPQYRDKTITLSNSLAVLIAREEEL